MEAIALAIVCNAVLYDIIIHRHNTIKGIIMAVYKTHKSYFIVCTSTRELVAIKDSYGAAIAAKQYVANSLVVEVKARTEKGAIKAAYAEHGIYLSEWSDVCTR